MATVTLSPLVWMSSMSFSLITLMINFWILQKERKKRHNTDIIYLSVHMKLLPLLIMINGVVAATFFIIQFVPGFCHFSKAFGAIATGFQTVSMGGFQLSRLHYCFANKQIHSKNGYSKSVFILMTGIGCLILIFILFACPNSINYRCGFNAEHNYYYSTMQTSKYLGVMISIYMFTYIIWDFTTLALYINKLKLYFQMTKTENKIKCVNHRKIANRINFTLFRMTILTLLYEFPIMIGVPSQALFSFDYTFCANLFSVSISYASFLMQEHNIAEYECFLHKLVRYKIYICCICCKSLIEGSIEYQSSEHISDMNKENNESTEYDTGNISSLTNTIKIGINSEPNALSVDSTIVQEIKV
eukprot:38883_1